MMAQAGKGTGTIFQNWQFLVSIFRCPGGKHRQEIQAEHDRLGHFCWGYAKLKRLKRFFPRYGAATWRIIP